MKEITKEEVLQLLSEVCNLLNEAKIDYLVYGSMAYLLHGDREIQPHDIDLIVKEEDFEKISSLLNSLNFNPIKTEYSIHANSTEYMGFDNKPFDISFDSYEHYFEKHNIDLNNFEILKIQNAEIKVVKQDDLKKIYLIGVKQGYERAAESYLSQRNKFKDNKFLEKLIELLKPGSTILDIGCGAGVPIDKLLIESGFKIIGIDVSEKQIELARQNIPQGNFEVKDMMELKEGEYKVDAVISFYAIFHTPREKHQELFKKINSFLPSGGLILVTMGAGEWEGTEEDFYGAKMWWSHYGPEKNKEIIENAGFEILMDEIESYDKESHLVILGRKK